MRLASQNEQILSANFAINVFVSILRWCFVKMRFLSSISEKMTSTNVLTECNAVKLSGSRHHFEMSVFSLVVDLYFWCSLFSHCGSIGHRCVLFCFRPFGWETYTSTVFIYSSGPVMKRLIVHHVLTYGIRSFHASGHLLRNSENWQQTH